MAALRTNYIFIDFENVTDIDLSLIKDKPVKVILLVGAQRKTLPIRLAAQLISFAAQVELVEMQHGGKNALDLLLSVYLGLKKATDPEGIFNIVSGDTDYDPVINQLKSQDTRIKRFKTFAEIPLLVDWKKASPDKRLKVYQSKLTSVSLKGAGNPATLKTLKSSISAHFFHQLTDHEIEAVVSDLKKCKALQVSKDGKVAYPSATREPKLKLCSVG